MKILLLAILISCSQLNTSSRDYYYEKKSMRHGIIPLPPSKKQPPINKVAAKRGEKVFDQKCSRCHGPQGQDLNNQSRNLQNVVRDVPNFKFYMKVSQMVGNMPGWKNNLSEQDLRDISHYLRSLAFK